MLEFQEKRKVRKFLYSKYTLVLLLVLVVFSVNGVWKVYKKQDLTKDNLNKIATNFESLQVREKMLSSEIERLKTEDGREEEIREKYGLVKPGEEVIIVVNKNNISTTSVSQGFSFWQKIVNWFK